MRRILKATAFGVCLYFALAALGRSGSYIDAGGSVALFLLIYLTGKLVAKLEDEPAESVTRGCADSGDTTKDPRGCWNVRCQLGKTCCRAALPPSPEQP